MANGKYFLCFSILFMLPLNKSYKNRKVSLTIHCKYKYFDSTVQRAEDRRQKFYFCRLPFAVNIKLNVTIVYISPNFQNCARVFIILQSFYTTRAVLKIGGYSRISPSFSWGIVVTCLDQSRRAKRFHGL